MVKDMKGYNMTIELTDEQKALKKEILHWYNNFPNGKPYYYYSGAAGTGKTTVMKSIIEDLGLGYDEYMACAFVGKAVLVLLQNGLNASTIHSFIYMPTTETHFETKIDEWGNPHKVKKVKSKFVLRNKIDKKIKVIFVDEIAMVSDKIREDLQSFGIPIICAGDGNQLPPVIGTSSILDDPDFILHQIMRQEEGNPIVYLSQKILKDEPIEYGSYGDSRVIEYYEVNESLLTDFDIILCARNKTRESLNNQIREEILGFEDILPREGEKMICRRNNWDESIGMISLTNGLVGNIEKINKVSLHRDILYANFKPDFLDTSFKKLAISYKYLKMDWKERKEVSWVDFKDQELFEYAYAITVHLSQGSEYNHVFFMDEKFGDSDMTKKLRYTAVTRAKKSITWVKAPDDHKRYIHYNGAVFEAPNVDTSFKTYRGY